MFYTIITFLLFIEIKRHSQIVVYINRQANVYFFIDASYYSVPACHLRHLCFDLTFLGFRLYFRRKCSRRQSFQRNRRACPKKTIFDLKSCKLACRNAVYLFWWKSVIILKYKFSIPTSGNEPFSKYNENNRKIITHLLKGHLSILDVPVFFRQLFTMIKLLTLCL